MVKRLRPEVATFVQNEERDFALLTAEQIVEDENTIQLYELLHESCQDIVNNLPYIRRRHRDCPNEVSRAVSALAFAASSCPDLPELQTIRHLFIERYGEDLFDKASSLREGSHNRFFNLGVEERLALMRRAVSDDMKVRKVSEIIGVDVTCGRSYRHHQDDDEDGSCGGSSIEKVWKSLERVNVGMKKSSAIPKASSMPQLGGWCRSDKDLETTAATSMKRIASLPSMLPSHVHPKLPDCDDLEEKFRALKMEYMKVKRSVAEPILYID
ncbi:unnamed protein product [Linum tenue]|uniref:Uncharacterized protein n=1 Tax=Linum tenue TaxID=586396 RepID=A0AAV0K8D5_9ROSI|nr:unnamed protein product [Linum tenue]